MSWKPEVKVKGDPDWYPNALRFATEEEAEAYAVGLFYRWTLTTAYRVVECDDPITYAMVNGDLVPVKPGDVA